MKAHLLAGVIALFLACPPLVRAADAKLEALKQDVADTIAAFKKADPDLETFFRESAGYAVFPKVGKGAIGIGGARGRGELFEKGTAIGETTLTQVTIGFQLGGQVYAEVVFFENQAALDHFKNENFEMSAQVSAVAAAEGASKNAKYSLGVAVFTLARSGLMYEASVGGQKFRFKPYR